MFLSTKVDRERIEKIEKTRYHSEVKPKIKQTKNQLNVLRTSFQVLFLTLKKFTQQQIYL